MLACIVKNCQLIPCKALCRMHKLLCFEEHLAHPIAEGKKTSTAVLACMAKGHDARKKRDSCAPVK
jgi:hypothetical protein